MLVEKVDINKKDTIDDEGSRYGCIERVNDMYVQFIQIGLHTEADSTDVSSR